MADTSRQTTLRYTPLRGHGLRLRLWDANDTDAVERAAADPACRRWDAAFTRIVDAGGPLHYVTTRAEGWAQGGRASFCITDAGTDTVLGHAELNEIGHHMAAVGYWLLPEARGRGIVTRAVELCTRWGFDRLGLHRIDLGHAAGNDASCLVAKRCGYRPEGTLRDFFPVPGTPGAYDDMHLHARLATDPTPALR